MQAAETSSNLAMLLIRVMKYGEMACVTLYNFAPKIKKMLKIKFKLILTFDGKFQVIFNSLLNKSSENHERLRDSNSKLLR